MAFGRDIIYSVSVAIPDPTEDEAQIPLWRVPAELTKVEVLEAWVCTNTVLAAGTANGVEVSLLDGGSDATGTAIVGAAIGGTGVGGTFPAWGAGTPQSFTISEGTLDAGDYLVLKYEESGTAAGLHWIVSFNYVSGVGA